MRDIAQRLLTEEFRAGDFVGTKSHAAFRVCEKLRVPLSTLVGVVGFRSLLTRALFLAKAEVPQLGGLQVNRTGSFECRANVGTRLEEMEIGEGGIELVGQLLRLLVTFIGEALTLRLVDDVWPKAVRRNSESKGKPL